LCGWQIDKWHLGAARLVDFAAIALLLVRVANEPSHKNASGRDQLTSENARLRDHRVLAESARI
jgi:hypothetical protein